MPKTNGLIEKFSMGHTCSCVKLDLNLDGGHLPLGISLWQEILRTEATGDGNFSGVILPFGCLADFYPIAPKIRRDTKGGFKTRKTTSDTLERLTQRTLMNRDRGKLSSQD